MCSAQTEDKISVTTHFKYLIGWAGVVIKAQLSKTAFAYNKQINYAINVGVFRVSFVRKFRRTLVFLIAAFLKLWSADHKWSSGSALVVLLD